MQIEKELPKLAFLQSTVAQLPTNRDVYLILDSANFNAINLVFSSGKWMEFNMLYHDTDLKDQLKISPIIVKYNDYLCSKSSKWWNHSIAFTTTTDLNDTANHLKSLIYCEMPNKQPAFFRFYAQSWLEPLITGQNEDTLYEFTGPIDNWYIPMDDGQWQQKTIISQTASKTAKNSSWFKLTKTLQDKLAEYSYQKFIDQLTVRCFDLPLDTEDGQHFRSTIKRHVEQAKSFGIEQQNHITQYVDLALCYAMNIEDDRAIEILVSANDTTSNLELLAQYLRDLDIEQIVSSEDKYMTSETNKSPNSL